MKFKLEMSAHSVDEEEKAKLEALGFKLNEWVDSVKKWSETYGSEAPRD